MNKDINKTLMALVPILKMNGENVTNIEAVHDWYKVGDREYMKEVAEITYDNGTVRYADIGCDSNLTAIYDVIAVIQQIKPRSKAIERIERGVYSLPSAQPEPRWIPCSERLPEEYGEFLVTMTEKAKAKDLGFDIDETYIRKMRYNSNGWQLPRHIPSWINEAVKDEVLAWMPLPEPYKAESEDKE